MNIKKTISSSVTEKEKTERGKKTRIPIYRSRTASLNSGKSQSRVKLEQI